mmetsp:Transcript_47624/g.101953  ORF Transcript_47624/g.101953 Transcript_47624/m.101953 type:complete len:298 (+) Transcript_47624:99-992(+)|eukprot:CAMPEP_0206458148 /NCGR_PEP_ID=MMETSP0324_2-20121206/23387_1 /ASSEMBLY_ACC=CAM_ASM_000836 /TAXON_ID=2866 /ORGANISM="Crypthecodinium cohnii, Strain Seligo" /LENGTH=297 /DNA_ID=CAMNT_0053929411 /DNA_START=44 /DNA_END=937 /DNA_ORIENTATION=-
MAAHGEPSNAVDVEDPKLQFVEPDHQAKAESDGDGEALCGLFVWEKAKDGHENHLVSVKAAISEMIALWLFVIIGCGTACSMFADSKLAVCFAFGFGIVVLAYAIGHHSGGQINCAVTFALVLAGELNWKQGIFNVFFQIIGSFLGAGTLAVMFGCDTDQTQSLGTNKISEAYGAGAVLVGEMFGTFLLCFVVFQTAVHSGSQAGHNPPIAIGFAVFLAHTLLLNVDGCSINPTRSIGPAAVGAMRKCGDTKGLEDLWVFIVGPMLGAAIAAGHHKLWLDVKPALTRLSKARHHASE